MKNEGFKWTMFHGWKYLTMRDKTVFAVQHLVFLILAVMSAYGFVIYHADRDALGGGFVLVAPVAFIHAFCLVSDWLENLPTLMRARYDEMNGETGYYLYTGTPFTRLTVGPLIIDM